jgi:hypothetical protein
MGMNVYSITCYCKNLRSVSLVAIADGCHQEPKAKKCCQKEKDTASVCFNSPTKKCCDKTISFLKLNKEYTEIEKTVFAPFWAVVGCTPLLFHFTFPSYPKSFANVQAVRSYPVYPKPPPLLPFGKWLRQWIKSYRC